MKSIFLYFLAIAVQALNQKDIVAPIDQENYGDGIYLINQDSRENKKYINYEKKGFIPHKKEGTKRIVILGDSVTDGHGSSNKIENSWPAEFFKLIQDDQHFELYNCAYAAKTISRKSGLAYMDLK